jgi:hypothetical protein
MCLVCRGLLLIYKLASRLATYAQQTLRLQTNTAHASVDHAACRRAWHCIASGLSGCAWSGLASCSSVDEPAGLPRMPSRRCSCRQTQHMCTHVLVDMFHAQETETAHIASRLSGRAVACLASCDLNSDDPVGAAAAKWQQAKALVPLPCHDV